MPSRLCAPSMHPSHVGVPYEWWNCGPGSVTLNCGATGLLTQTTNTDVPVLHPSSSLRLLDLSPYDPPHARPSAVDRIVRRAQPLLCQNHLTDRHIAAGTFARQVDYRARGGENVVSGQFLNYPDWFRSLVRYSTETAQDERLLPGNCLAYAAVSNELGLLAHATGTNSSTLRLCSLRPGPHLGASHVVDLKDPILSVQSSANQSTMRLLARTRQQLHVIVKSFDNCVNDEEMLINSLVVSDEGISVCEGDFSSVSFSGLLDEFVAIGSSTSIEESTLISKLFLYDIESGVALISDCPLEPESRGSLFRSVCFANHPRLVVALEDKRMQMFDLRTNGQIAVIPRAELFEPSLGQLLHLLPVEGQLLNTSLLVSSVDSLALLDFRRLDSPLFVSKHMHVSCPFAFDCFTPTVAGLPAAFLSASRTFGQVHVTPFAHSDWLTQLADSAHVPSMFYSCIPSRLDTPEAVLAHLTSRGSPTTNVHFARIDRFMRGALFLPQLNNEITVLQCYDGGDLYFQNIKDDTSYEVSFVDDSAYWLDVLCSKDEISERLGERNLYRDVDQTLRVHASPLLKAVPHNADRSVVCKCCGAKIDIDATVCSNCLQDDTFTSEVQGMLKLPHLDQKRQVLMTSHVATVDGGNGTCPEFEKLCENINLENAFEIDNDGNAEEIMRIWETVKKNEADVIRFYEPFNCNITYTVSNDEEMT